MKVLPKTNTLFRDCMSGRIGGAWLPESNKIGVMSRERQPSIRIFPIIAIGVFLAAAWLTQLGGCRINRQPVDTKAIPEVRVTLPDPEGASNLSDIRPLQTGPGRRHVIIVIGDGMQRADEVATSRYLYGIDYGLSFHALPEKSFATTWDINVYDFRAAELGVPPYSPNSYDPTVGYDPVRGGETPYPMLEDSEQRRAYFYHDAQWPAPDSASTATAMSTGIKTYSASIAWPAGTGDNQGLETSPALLRRFYEMSIGFVSTVPLSHATPAGFFAHNRHRDRYIEIAHEILTQVRPEVVIGGNWGEDTAYYDQWDVDHVIASDDYVFVHLETGVDGNDSIKAAARRAVREKKRLLGIYDGGNRSTFPSPVAVDSPGSPRIERDSIESPMLADASVAALEVLSRDPQGFFLLIEQGHIDWANHNNDFARMVGCVADLDAAVRAVIDFVDRPDDAVDWSNTTLIVTADHATGYTRFDQTLGRGDLPNEVVSTDPQLSISYPDQEITYGTTSHTSELVSVYAKGFAAAKLHDYETVYPNLAIIDDTAIYRITLDAARR